MWQPLVRHRRLIGGAAAGLVVVVAITVVIDLLGQRWVSAIQASTTLLLLLATAMYAYLTWRLVRATEDPPAVRLTSHRRAAENVVRTVRRVQVSLRLLGRWFPLDSSGELPTPDLFTVNKEVDALIAPLDDALVGLPLDLQALAAEASLKADVATLVLYMLEQATETAGSRASNGSSADKWAIARETYDYYRLARRTDYALPTWEEVVDGSVVRDAAERIDSLVEAANRYLFGIPPT